MKTDKLALERMLKNGIRTITEEELKAMIEAELQKPDDEIDTDFIDLCFSVMACETNRRITLRHPVRTLLIAAAILILAVSGISVLASNTASPIRLLPVAQEETTAPPEETTEALTTARKSRTGTPSGSSAGDSSNSDDASAEEESTTAEEELLTVPSFIGMNVADVESQWGGVFSFTYTYETMKTTSIPAGTVIDQSAMVDDVIERGATIRLVICETPLTPPAEETQPADTPVENNN